MKNIGQQAKAFREAKGWSYTRMAKEVTKHHSEVVSRQLITQLEEAGDRTPRYLRALAMAMGTTSDALLSGLEETTPKQAEDAGHVAESPEAEYAVSSTITAIQALTQHLSAVDTSTRERAATLLANMAKDPTGPWAEWLISLLCGENNNKSGTTSIADDENQKQNEQLDLSNYPGLKNATQWRRGATHGVGDHVKTPKKQGGNGA